MITRYSVSWLSVEGPVKDMPGNKLAPETGVYNSWAFPAGTERNKKYVVIKRDSAPSECDHHQAQKKKKQ